MKIKKIFFYLFFVQASYAYDANDNISKYLEYFSFIGFGNAGNYKNGEMQIVDDYDAMLQIQHQYYNQFIKKGLKHDAAKQYSRVGIVQEDLYWIWLRDPLILPNHTTTAYNRFFPRSGLNGVSGIVVMIVSRRLSNILNIHVQNIFAKSATLYFRPRHALRPARTKALSFPQWLYGLQSFAMKPYRGLCKLDFVSDSISMFASWVLMKTTRY